jgi:hypothetical protein
MQRMLFLALFGLAVTSLSSQANAQDTASYEKDHDDVSSLLPSDGTATPEMWFYLQEYRRYQSPKEAVRRKAEQRSAQRRNRLAAQRWFGFSNLRPTANPIPYYSSYSPAWIGNSQSPFSWSGQGLPYVIYHSGPKAGVAR